MADDDIKDKGTIIPFPKSDKDVSSQIGADYVLGPTKDNASAPEIISQESIDKELRDRENFVSNQSLVQSIKRKESNLNLIDAVIGEIAEELAHLKYERVKAAKEGKNTSGYTINRISSLRQLSEVLTKRIDSARSEQIDLKSPRFKTILKLWMEFVYMSMQKAELPEHEIDLVFKQMEADMVNLEKRILDEVT